MESSIVGLILPAQVDIYLRAHGWEEHDPDDKGSLMVTWRKSINGERKWLDVPRIQHLRDYGRRMRDMLHELSEIDGCDAGSAARSMLGVQPIDLPSEIAVLAANRILRHLKSDLMSGSPPEDLTAMIAWLHGTVQECACTVLGDPPQNQQQHKTRTEG